MDWIKLQVGALIGCITSLFSYWLGIHWIVITGMFALLFKSILNGAGGALGGLVITMVAKYGAAAYKHYKNKKKNAKQKT